MTKGKEKEFLRILVNENIVQGGFDHIGLAAFQERDSNHADHRDGELAPIGFDEFEEDGDRGS